ncbi:MAG: hypothetical protein Q4G13_01275 [Moraxella sp.]|nr:hypothetical protein [Moraxella sp.]
MNSLQKIKLLKSLKSLNGELASENKPLKKIALLKQIRAVQLELGFGTAKADDKTAETDKADLYETLLQQVQYTGKVNLINLPKNTNYTTLKQSIKKIFESELKDKTVYCRAVSSDITLRNSTAKHILNNGGTRSKMQLLLKIPSLLEQASYLRKEVNNGSNTNVKAVHLVRADIMLDGKPEKVAMRVMEDNRGSFVYDMYVQIDGKISQKNNGLDVPAGGDEAVPTLSKPLTDSLTNNHYVVNTFDSADTGKMVLNLFFEHELSSLTEQTKTPTSPRHERPAPPTTKATRQQANNAAITLLETIQDKGLNRDELSAEQLDTLAKYTGNGGGIKNKDGLIGSDYEYYTPKEVASGMWELAVELGFNGGTVLDPSAGTGIFAATAPKSTVMTNVELDETSGGICQVLNDGADTHTQIMPFEQAVQHIERRLKKVCVFFELSLIKLLTNHTNKKSRTTCVNSVSASILAMCEAFNIASPAPLI